MNNKKGHPVTSSPKQITVNGKAFQLGKEDSMLLRFAQGKRYHRFSAEPLGDHCLPTTVSDLQINYGLIFSRKRIKVPNRFGGLTSVMLYWLDDAHLEKARKILGLDEAAA